MDAEDPQDTASGARSGRDIVRMRAQATGRRVVPPEPEEPASWVDVIAASVEAGTAVSEALAAERLGE